MALLDLVREVKAGTRKLSDVKPGLQAHVRRLLPVVDVDPAAPRMTYAVKGLFTARSRRARST